MNERAALQKIKLAFIGAGYMTREHIIAFSRFENVELVGVHSRPGEKLDSLLKDYPYLTYYPTIKDLHLSTKADAVVISVPELATKAICESAFKYSWISMIEKPVGYCLEEAEYISNLAKKLRHKSFIALNRRHYAATSQALSCFNNDYGARFIRVQDQENLIAAKDAGQPDKILENWMFANSIHIIDYLLLFGRGSVEKVHKLVKWDPKNPRLVLAKIKFSSGDIGLYEGVWNGPSPWSVSIKTQKNMIELRPLESGRIWNARDRKFDKFIHLEDQLSKPGLFNQAKKLLEACSGVQNDLPSLEEGLKTMKLTHEIYFE
jgi:predicted dehydrogenase